ncbi:MAG: hypothetical protein ED557_13545 [Balneola sp.]|nr:MAG: hypothetical protein ED557_13545 [Balneola sp.]
MTITDTFYYYIIKGSLIVQVPFIGFIIYELIVGYNSSGASDGNWWNISFLLIIPISVLVLNFVKWSGLEVIVMTDKGFQLKEELVPWEKVHRIYLKDSNDILVIEFYKQKELYIAKTIVAPGNHGNSGKAKKILDQVYGAWGNSKAES